MKKLKLFFALFAMLALGVGNAWGAEELKETITPKDNGSDSNTAFTTTTALSNGFVSNAAINAVTEVSKVYPGNGGWKFGSSSAAGEISFTLKTPISNVTKIVITAKQYHATKKTTLNCNDIGAKTLTTSFADYEYEYTTPTEVSTISLVSAKASSGDFRCYVKEIKIYAETTSGGSTETVVSVPTFSVPAGTFYSPINVELSCSTADAEIYYTLDGTTPNSESEKYTTAITISETTTINAIAVKDGLTDSEVATATYTKGEIVTSYDIDFEKNALEAYVNWDFSNITIAKTITAKGGTTYYGNTSGKASASIKTKEKIQYPGILTFSVSKESTNTTASNWLVQVSENGTTWSTVGTISATEMTKGNWNDHSVDLSDYENVYVQISYSGTTAIRAIDEISLAQGVAPVKYTLTIETPENGTLLVTNGGASVASGDQFKAGTSLVVTPTPEAGYVFESLTVDGSAVELTDGTYTFNMPAAGVTIAATFKENEKPAATLTLSKNGVTETFPGSWKQDDKVTLPSITSDCVKEFVGWSADDKCATEPEYKDGDEYTLASTTQTLYAVYATVGGGGEATAANTLSSNGWANESKHTSLQIDENVKAEITGTGLSNSGKYYTSGTNWRLYQNENPNLTISTTIGELKSVKFTFTSEKTGTLLYNGTKLTSGTAVSVSGTSAIFTVGNSTASVTNGQIRISKIEVVYTGGVSYSNYSTTCVAALAAPTFSVAEGTYTEAKSIELSATEGTIYYTLDGSTPTASSEKYTTPIVLDECGEHTIKAIAISADSESPVASATYEIQLPIPANSETDPYTEAEAIEIYNGGCYDGAELVYVKGTVKTATFYTSGTYTITLTNGFQFYKFYKSATKELFTDGAINTGDVLVACGKLSKYNTTYQLAEGCYLVAHEPYTEPKVDISNTEASAYTVDKAFELIGDVSSDLTKTVYVKGLVAVAPTSNPTADGQMTYSISDNGEKTGKVLKVYLGLGLNGDKFTSKNDLKLGDYVVVKGLLLDYNGTYELNKGNQLVQHVKAATITIADITMEVDETKTIAATLVPAEAEVTYTIKENTDNAISLSGNKITALAVGTATITASVAEGADYLANSVDFTVTVNPQNIATLPFAFDDGVNDIKNTLGMSQKNLGTDYGSSPKLKFDDKDDYVIIHFDKRPGILSYDIKANTGSGVFTGEFAVQESADGVTYRDLVKYSTISGSKETKTHNCFDKDTRYIKFIFVAKDNGNVALGNIKIETSVVTKVTPSVVEKGIFSVGDGKFVQFSTGNLQYEVGTNTWSFASKQYEVIGGEAYTGSNNTNYGMNEPGYTGKLDLFAWSCDGKFGVNPSNADADYTGEFADWGNLVNEEGWYTLTATEMNYLLNRKKDGKKLWALATVCGMNGLILLPDNWNTSTTLEYGYVPADWNYTKNQLDAAAWVALETAGAVFLPEGGSRVGGYGNKIGFDGATVETDDYFHVDNVGDYGYYWLNTQDTRPAYPHCASYLILPGWSEGATNADNDDLCLQPQVWSREKRRGNSVRLVKAIEPDYTREVRQGYYGTICLENGGQMIGASLFELSYYKEAQGLLYMEETADATMVAGNPYIFLPNERATKDSLYVFCDETTVLEADTVNGLVGYLGDENMQLPGDGTNYILQDNKIKKVVGGNNSNVFVTKNRAYIQLGSVEPKEQAPVPGRRRVAIGQAPQVATGMESVDASAQPVKMIIDGQLFILRGEKMYDAQGKLVK